MVTFSAQNKYIALLIIIQCLLLSILIIIRILKMIDIKNELKNLGNVIVITMVSFIIVSLVFCVYLPNVFTYIMLIGSVGLSIPFLNGIVNNKKA